MSRGRLAEVLAYAERVPPAVWALLALFAVMVAARHIRPLVLLGRPDDHLLTTGDVLPALPILFAAAVVFAVPRRRLLVAGAVVMAVTAALTIGARFVALPENADAVGYVLVAGLFVAGPLLFAHGLGRVTSRPGVFVVALALVLAIVSAINAATVGSAIVEADLPFGTLVVASGVMAQFVVLSWGYVLAAALSRGAKLIAAGAALMILMDGILLLALDVLARQQPPGLVVPGAGTVFLVLTVVAWAALIAGVFREVGQQPGQPSA
jgi:hypothetical protein